LGKYFGDIVVGDIGDIDQPQCHKCLFSLSCTRFFYHFVHMWHCGWPMSPTTMSPKCYPINWCGLSSWA